MKMMMKRRRIIARRKATRATFPFGDVQRRAQGTREGYELCRDSRDYLASQVRLVGFHVPPAICSSRTWFSKLAATENAASRSDSIPT
jgi:hypothetical protein